MPCTGRRLECSNAVADPDPQMVRQLSHRQSSQFGQLFNPDAERRLEFHQVVCSSRRRISRPPSLWHSASSIFRIELDCLIAVAQRLIGLALLDMRRATVGVEDCKTRAVIPARVDGSREARPRQGVARNRLEIGLRDQTAPALQPPSSSAAARRDNWCDHCNETSLALPRLVRTSCAFEFPHLRCLSIASSSASSDRGEIPSSRNPGRSPEAVVSICISST
jgi:hypothetical protein